MVFINRPLFALFFLSISTGGHAGWSDWSWDDGDKAFDDDPFFNSEDALVDPSTTSGAAPTTTTTGKPGDTTTAKPSWLDKMRNMNDRQLEQTRQFEQQFKMDDMDSHFQHTSPELDKYDTRLESMKTMRNDFFEKNKYVKTSPEAIKKKRRKMKDRFAERKDHMSKLFRAYQGDQYDDSMTLAAIKREEDEMLNNVRIYQDNGQVSRTFDDSLQSILPSKGFIRLSDMDSDVSNSDFDELNTSFKDEAENFDSMQTVKKADVLESAAELINKPGRSEKSKKELTKKINKIVSKHEKLEKQKAEEQRKRLTAKWWEGRNACSKKQYIWGDSVEMESGQTRVVIQEDCMAAADVDSYTCTRMVKEDGKMKKETETYSCCKERAVWDPDTKWCIRIRKKQRGRNSATANV